MAESEKTQINIIVVAAGSGSRYGSSLPKQFCLLAGRPVLMHTLDAFRLACPDARLIVVLSDSMTAFWQDLCRQYGFRSPEVVLGGATRWESVKNAVEKCEAPGLTLVHDGARPLVDKETVERVILAARKDGAAIPAVSVSDSLRRVGEDGESEAVDRSMFRAVQTPQAFDTGLLKKSYGQPYAATFTDDASVVEACGHEITLVEGSPRNIKITNPGDIAVAEAMMGWGGSVCR